MACSVAGDVGIDGAGPGVDATGYGLGVGEALVAEPDGDVEGAGAVVAEDEDGLVFVELLEGALGDVAHGHEGGAFDVGGVVLPGLTYVEEQRRVGGSKLGLQVVDGDLEIHAVCMVPGAVRRAITEVALLWR